MVRRLVLLVIALVLSAGAIPQAHADSTMNFVGVAATCDQGAFTFQLEEPQNETVALQSLQASGNTIVEAWDANGALLGSDGFNIYFYEGPTVFSGIIDFASEPASPVTFRLYYDYSIFGEGIAQSMVLADTATTPVDCTGEASVPGCDTLMALNGAVVGRFVTDTRAYYDPSANTLIVPAIDISAGKTLYVFGEDSTHSYNKVLLQCQYVWVPIGTVGPNPDKVWNNTPLPTAIVH